LIFAVCDIDEVVRLIRSSKTREEAMQKLRERAFRIAPDHPVRPADPAGAARPRRGQAVLLSQAQAEAIGRLQLIQLVGLEIEKLVEEYRRSSRRSRVRAILRDERRVLDIIVTT
jgi:DNA gyrase subunit A